MWRILSLALALALSAPAQATVLRGIARNQEGDVRVTIALTNGTPTMIDLAYSLVTLHPFISYTDYGINASTYQGLVGSADSSAVNATETYLTRVRFSDWRALSASSFSVKAKVAGSYSYRDDGMRVSFRPESGDPKIVYFDPPTSSQHSIGMNRRVQASFTRNENKMIFVVQSGSPIFNINLTLHRKNLHAWTVSVRTTRIITVADFEGPVRAIQRGTLRTVEAPR